jgi:hypothetical protein
MIFFEKKWVFLNNGFSRSKPGWGGGFHPPHNPIFVQARGFLAFPGGLKDR